MANVKIGLFGKLDMLKFKNITKVREKHIQASPTTPLPKVLFRSRCCPPTKRQNSTTPRNRRS